MLEKKKSKFAQKKHLCYNKIKKWVMRSNLWNTQPSAA